MSVIENFIAAFRERMERDQQPSPYCLWEQVGRVESRVPLSFMLAPGVSCGGFGPAFGVFGRCVEDNADPAWSVYFSEATDEECVAETRAMFDRFAPDRSHPEYLFRGDIEAAKRDMALLMTSDFAVSKMDLTRAE